MTPTFLPGSDPAILQRGGALGLRCDKTGTAWFVRDWRSPQGFEWDAPGARFCLRTDSPRLAIHLRYTPRHLGPARNSIGYLQVDGVRDPSLRFSRPDRQDDLVITLPDTRRGRWREVEVILPYGDSVELVGVSLAGGAQLLPPPAFEGLRWAAFGDSVTQGFTASDISRTYPFLLGESMGWEVVNCGIGGRGTSAFEAAALADIAADIYTVAIGVNDWQGGAPLADFRREYAGFIETVKNQRPESRIYCITPLWVLDSWRPVAAGQPLESYREIIREIAHTAAVSLVEGLELIDHDDRFFDRVAVHPNDPGFAQMAQRLRDRLA